jgi:transposase
MEIQMTTQDKQYQNLVKLLLPSELFDYFEITKLVIADRTVTVFLDERDIKPSDYCGQKLSSKGFHSESIIQDFPIRNKAVFLHLRRRRWLVESTGKVVSRDWNSVAEGTRYTKSFADFLKGTFGQLPY